MPGGDSPKPGAQPRKSGGEREEQLLRNRKAIARLVPEPATRDALEVFGDLFRTLDDGAADALVEAIKRGRKGKGGALEELRDPWAF